MEPAAFVLGVDHVIIGESDAVACGTPASEQCPMLASVFARSKAPTTRLGRGVFMALIALHRQEQMGAIDYRHMAGRSALSDWTAPVP